VVTGEKFSLALQCSLGRVVLEEQDTPASVRVVQMQAYRVHPLP